MYKSSSSLQKYIDYLGLPMGIFPAIDQIYRAMDGRIWLIDNSSHMGEMDSHLIRADPDFGRIEKVDGVCRWAELSQCIDFHTKMVSIDLQIHRIVIYYLNGTISLDINAHLPTI
jgi:hypothetical protein